MERFFYLHISFKSIYIMKKLLLLLTLGLFISCSNVQNPDYEKNLEIAKEWFEVFVTEDMEATAAFYADEVEYQSAFYGGPIMNRSETLEYLQGWQDNMENIAWEAEQCYQVLTQILVCQMEVLEHMDTGLVLTVSQVKVSEVYGITI